MSTVSSTKPEILEIEFLKEILQSLGLVNAGLLLDAKKKRELLYSMKHSTVLQILKGKKKKNKSTVLNLAGFSV